MAKPSDPQHGRRSRSEPLTLAARWARPFWWLVSWANPRTRKVRRRARSLYVETKRVNRLLLGRIESLERDLETMRDRSDHWRRIAQEDTQARMNIRMAPYYGGTAEGSKQSQAVAFYNARLLNCETTNARGPSGPTGTP